MCPNRRRWRLPPATDDRTGCQRCHGRRGSPAGRAPPPAAGAPPRRATAAAAGAAHPTRPLTRLTSPRPLPATSLSCSCCSRCWATARRASWARWRPPAPTSSRRASPTVSPSTSSRRSRAPRASSPTSGGHACADWAGAALSRASKGAKARRRACCGGAHQSSIPARSLAAPPPLRLQQGRVVRHAAQLCDGAVQRGGAGHGHRAGHVPHRGPVLPPRLPRPRVLHVRHGPRLPRPAGAAAV